MNQATPVLVGVSQVLQHEDDPRAARPPLELMIDAIERASIDSDAPDLIRHASSVRVIQGIWGYANPALEIAEKLGLTNVETGLSVLGGNHVQWIVNQSAAEIQSGDRDVIVITGAECGRTLGRAQKAGLDVDWLERKGNDFLPDADVTYGDQKWTRHEEEMACGIARPAQYYAMFETALRHQRGETPREHRERVARLWASFSEVAQKNPNAWIRRPVTAEEIATPAASNRLISYPYPKLMMANMRVDMGAALIMCSLETARRLGVPEERIVFPASGTDAYDHYYVSERNDLHRSPAIRLAGQRVLELAEVEASELDFIDLYSCFPSAVQVAAAELGLALDRPLTVTGGLTFGGGPLNNYVMHSIARTVELLRETSDGRALVTANGGMLTKHAFGVYTRRQPSHPFRQQNLQREVDALPKRRVEASHRATAEIEAYTVMFGHNPPKPTKSYTDLYGKAAEVGNEPTVAHLACRLPDGSRTWANIEDRDTLSALCEQDACGWPVVIDGERNARLQ